MAINRGVKVGDHPSILDDRDNVHGFIDQSDSVFSFDVTMLDLDCEGYYIHNLDYEDSEWIGDRTPWVKKIDFEAALRKYGKDQHRNALETLYMILSENSKSWSTSKRKLDYSRKTLVMGILNSTPDSFSDGGKYISIDRALRRVESFVNDGADIIDIGGESTRPGSLKISDNDEIYRVVPIIQEIVSRFDIPLSVDTSKSLVAEAALDAGAEIINDISGLRFDIRIGEVVAKYKAGLVLMHSRGEFETLHGPKEPAENIIREVSESLSASITKARKCGISDDRICLDVGIGFGKTQLENLELIAKIDIICKEFSQYPMLIGTSRKSFIGKILDDAPTDGRLNGTVATNVISVWNGANIVRVHDVKAIAEALRLVDEIKKEL